MDFHPHLYQRRAIAFLIENPVGALWVDPGLGKTATVLTMFRALRQLGMATKMLIVAPKAVSLTVWQDERDKWDHLSDLRIATVVGTEKKRIKAIAEPADCYVTNMEAIPWLSDYVLKLAEPRRPKWDVLTIDESSFFKSPGAKRFRKIKRLLPHFNRRYILTGTPAPNGIADLWSQIYICDGGERLGPTVTEYRRKYFDRGGFQGREYLPREGAEETIQNLIGDIVFRLDAHDWLDLPELIVNDVWVDMPEAATKVYRDLEKQLIATLAHSDAIEADTNKDAGENPDEVVATSAAAKYIICRQIANGGAYKFEDDFVPGSGADRVAIDIHSAKVDAVERIISELGGKPVLVFYQFWHDLGRLRDRFGDCPAVNSKTKDLGEIVTAWNAGEIPILFAQPQSMSHGLNMQSGPGRDVIFFGLTDSLDVYQQAYKRVYRQGVGSSVRVHRILTRGTVDETIANRLDGKDGYQQSILDALKTDLTNGRN